MQWQLTPAWGEQKLLDFQCSHGSKKRACFRIVRVLGRVLDDYTCNLWLRLSTYYPMPISLSLDTIFYRSAKSTRNGPCSTAMWICNRWSHHAFSIGATAAGPDILLPTEFVYESNYDQVPIGSMYAIYGNIYHPYTPNVSIYTIHGSYGVNKTDRWIRFSWCFFESAPGIPAKRIHRSGSTYPVSRFFQLVPIRFGRQNEGHETSADWECKAHPPQSCLTQWIDQRWQIGGRFIAHFDALHVVFHPRLVPRMTLPSYAAAFRYRKCWQLAFFFKEPCSDVLWKLYEVVLCAQDEKIDFTYYADGSCPLRIYLAWHFWTVLNLQMVLVVYEPSASYASCHALGVISRTDLRTNLQEPAPYLKKFEGKLKNTEFPVDFHDSPLNPS